MSLSPKELVFLILKSKYTRGVDHMPIYKNDIHWNEIVKGLYFLIINNYKYNIVFEYGLEYCNGDTVKEKVIDYLNSIDYVSSRNVCNTNKQ